ncbi:MULTISPECIES: hypothetical protein [Haloarcula]|uniref:hypothetical protein n=1 Tax=Haloarcula TaxID=2237 RepID=UPI0023EBFAEB|nr:hypothetical protein [Halomicroarcula sp. XH51]
MAAYSGTRRARLAGIFALLFVGNFPTVYDISGLLGLGGGEMTLAMDLVLFAALVGKNRQAGRALDDQPSSPESD